VQTQSSGVAALALIALTGCSGAEPLPTTPTSKTDTASAFVSMTQSARAVDLGRCLRTVSDACFTANSMTTRVFVNAVGAPLNLTAAVIGTTVTLSWNAPIGDEVAAAYVIEAGSAPGAVDLANISICGEILWAEADVDADVSCRHLASFDTAKKIHSTRRQFLSSPILS
jgi:hypothetical protein